MKINIIVYFDENIPTNPNPNSEKFNIVLILPNILETISMQKAK